MTLAVIRSRALDGLQAPAVQVEVHLANGLPSFTLVGLADTEVKESRERVRAALSNAGFAFPHNKRITVNLAPADLPKESARFDLPIALGILAADGLLDPTRLAECEFAGELSLAGELRPVRARWRWAHCEMAGHAGWCCPRPARRKLREPVAPRSTVPRTWPRWCRPCCRARRRSPSPG
jgi:predicted ATPase with chaperone activity